MKKLISSFAFALLITPAFAQSFFVKAGIGGGIAGASNKLADANAYAMKNAIASKQGSLIVGVTHGNWQLEGGISYLQTGVTYVANESRYIPAAPYPAPAGETFIIAIALPKVRYTIKNNHIVMPLSVSYMLNKGKKFSYSPGAGVAMAHNFKSKVTSERVSTWYYPAEDAEVRYNHNKMSVMAQFKFDVQYKISKQLSVWASPSYQHMLTSRTTKVAGDNMSSTYDHALLLNVGVRYDLNCAGLCPFTCKRKAAVN